MRKVLTIAGRDLRTAYLSPFGIGGTAAFAALSGVLLVLDLGSNQARFDSWFAWLFILAGLLAALVTMRSFAEEERSGSLEILLTAPVTPGQVVLGKLFGALGLLGAMMSISVVCPILVATMAHPELGPIITGYVGAALTGAAFVTIGLAISAATANPLASASATALALVTLWFGGILGSGLGGHLGALLAYLSPANHVTGFLRGTLGVTDAVYFCSLIVVGIASTIGVLHARR